MKLFTIKPDMEEKTNRAKSCNVALGNYEHKLCSCEDKYTSVLSVSITYLLTSMMVEEGCKLQQDDDKNVFFNEVLPDDNICIIQSAADCPQINH